MSLFDLQKAWHQAVDEAQMSRSDRSAMAAHELRACAGIHTRSAIKGGQCMAITFGTMDACPQNAPRSIGLMSDSCPANASHTYGTYGAGDAVCDGSWRPNEIV